PFKYGECAVNALDSNMASMRDVHRSAERVRQFAEHLRHLSRRLEVKLVSGKLHAMRVAHGLAGLDAQQDILGMRVVVMQVVAIVRGYQRDASFFREAH